MEKIKQLTDRYVDKLYWMMFDVMEGNIEEHEFRDEARHFLVLFLGEMWCESANKFLQELK